MPKTNGRKKKAAALLSVKNRAEALAALNAAGFKQKDIAVALDVDESTVSRWFSDQRNPDKDNMRGMYDKFGVPLLIWV